MNYKVTLEAAWIVKDIKTYEDAKAIALSEAGKKLNPKLNYVDINIIEMKCKSCNKKMNIGLIANTAIIGLMLSLKIYNAESEDHASHIGKSIVGKAFKNIPLRVINVDII